MKNFLNSPAIKIFSARFKKQLKMPQVYISAVLLSVFTSVNFFIKNQFFSAGGTTDLVMYFSNIPYILVIIIPVLCYKSSFSAYDDFIPLSPFKKILVNYTGIICIYIIMLLLLIPGIIFINFFGDVDFSQVFTAFFCLIFYGSCISALCILISKIFSQSVISLIICVVILSVFSTSHLFAVYVALPEFLGVILKEISFSWHFDAASKSIIDSRDFIFFAACTFLFLYLAYLAECSKKGKRFLSKEKLTAVLAVFVFLLTVFDCTRYYTRFDLSKNKTYTPGTFSKNLINSLNEPVKITYYCSSSLNSLYPQIRDIKDFLSSYSTMGKNISFIIKNPDRDENIKNVLQNMGISPQQLRSVSRNSTEYTYVYSAIVIEYSGNTETIPFLMSAASLEYDIDGRLLHLVSGNSRSVNIITGNGMTLDYDYSYVIPWLSSQGFECNDLDVFSSDFEEKLSRCTGPLLVLGDGEIPVEKAIAVENYILQGRGNALFAVSPYNADIENSWYILKNRYTNIVEIAENWGVYFKDEIAADVSCERISMYSDDNTDSKVLNYPQWISLLPQENAKAGLTLFWASPLELSDAEPYLITSPASYSYKTDSDSPESLVQTNPFLLEEQDKSGFEYKTQIVGARIRGKREGLYTTFSRDDVDVIVIPDQYFVNTLMNSYTGSTANDFHNFLFLTNALLKLNGEEELAALQEKTSRDTSLYKIRTEEEFLRLKNITLIFLLIIIPSLIVTGGFFAFFKTKKIRQN